MNTQTDTSQPVTTKPYAGYPGRPLKFQNRETLQKAIDNYFNQAENGNRPVSIMGLCLHLDIGRQTLLDYQNGRSNNAAFADIIARAKDKVLCWYEEHPVDDPRYAKHSDAMMERIGWCKPQPQFANVIPGGINILIMGPDGAKQIVSRDVTGQIGERIEQQLPGSADGDNQG